MTMEVLLGWLQLVLLIVAAGIVGGAIVSAAASRVWLEKLKSVAPRARLILLSALIALPVVAGVSTLAIAFAPSVLDALGVVRDHCSHHGHHAFHLCFVHSHPPEPSGLFIGASTVLFLWLAAAWGEEFACHRRTQEWSGELKQLSSLDKDHNYWSVPTDRPLAATVGLVNPEIYISEKMRELASAPEQFEAVVAHEKTHARRRHSLMKFVLRLCAKLLFPSYRTRLLEELDLACEQVCDEAAADSVGDRLTVAEALLAVERAFGPDELPASAVGFGATALERRVRGMLDGDWNSPNWIAIGCASALLLGTGIFQYDTLHHAAETALALLF